MNISFFNDTWATTKNIRMFSQLYLGQFINNLHIDRHKKGLEHVWVLLLSNHHTWWPIKPPSCRADNMKPMLVLMLLNTIYMFILPSTDIIIIEGLPTLNLLSTQPSDYIKLHYIKFTFYYWCNYTQRAAKSPTNSPHQHRGSTKTFTSHLPPISDSPHWHQEKPTPTPHHCFPLPSTPVPPFS